MMNGQLLRSLGFVALVFAAANPVIAETAPLTVAAFIAANQREGTALIEGHVVGSFTCPPCPEGAMCEPCAPDAIYIADTPVAMAKSYDTRGKNDLVIEVDSPSLYQFGKRFRFKVEVNPRKHDGLNELKLIEATPR